MLTLLALLLLPGLSLLPISPVMQQPSKLELPPQARDALYLKFPDWRYADISDEVRQLFKEDAAANTRPDLITGDFDGDGRADFAALILHGTTRVEQNEVVGPRLQPRDLHGSRSKLSVTRYRRPWRRIPRADT